uniref:Uncharacterized protein n=1 Tax=Arundo donax TaxID=35708 RepID=A0A0A9DNS3_ARUDO
MLHVNTTIKPHANLYPVSFRCSLGCQVSSCRFIKPLSSTLNSLNICSLFASCI